MAPAGTYVEANGLQVYYEAHTAAPDTSQSRALQLPLFAEHALSRVGQVFGPMRHAVQTILAPFGPSRTPSPVTHKRGEYSMFELLEGTLEGGLPYVCVGDGPPLVVFVAGGPTNANPTGWQRRYEGSWPRAIAWRLHDLKNLTRRDRGGEDQRAHLPTVSSRVSFMVKVDQFADSHPENYVS